MCTRVSNPEEEEYLSLIAKIVQHGDEREARNSVCKTVFGASLSFDLSRGNYPLLTTKKVSFRNVFYELKWFLMGDCNVRFLQDNGVKIWNANAEQWGNKDLGPIYGKQFRSSGPKEIDQIRYCLDLIQKNPTSRRIVISLWNPSDLPDQALPCCHGTVIQFFVTNGYLCMQMYQRSADVCLGLPYNIASYSLLLILMSHCSGLLPGKLKILMGDSHIYQNHLHLAGEQAARFPMTFPNLRIKDGVYHTDPACFEWEDFELHDYHHQAPIKYGFVV